MINTSTQHKPHQLNYIIIYHSSHNFPLENRDKQKVNNKNNNKNLGFNIPSKFQSRREATKD